MFTICSKCRKGNFAIHISPLYSNLVHLLPKTECLNGDWFASPDEARRKREACRRDYNELRPHSSMGGKTPRELHPPRDNSDQPRGG
jgi:transposase InsO family protein